MIVEEIGQQIRVVHRSRCASCGASQEFVGLRKDDVVDHACGWHGSGSTWWVHRAAGR